MTTRTYCRTPSMSMSRRCGESWAPTSSAPSVAKATSSMFSSLRARLLAWYTVVLAAVIATFVGSVCYLFWRSLVVEIDRTLESSGTALVQALRPAGPDEFDLDLPLEFRRNDLQTTGDGSYYAIWNKRAEPIDGSLETGDIPVPAVAGLRTRDGRRELALPAPNGAMVLVGRDLEPVRARVVALAQSAIAGGVGALLVSLIGGWFFVGRALAPISRITRAAAAMSAGDLRARIAVEETENELEGVARALNGAFDRLQRALESQRQFTADASHELRTPLTTVTTEVEWVLGRSRAPEDYRRSLEVCQRAAARMKQVVERLLALARVDDGRSVPQRRRVELAASVSEALALVEPLAQRKAVAIETSLDPAAVDGDPDQLTDLVTNLVSNAIEYNREGGNVHVDVWSAGADACVRVRDTGIGITEQDIPRVFDRFYRADRSRTARNGGVGLGLAIAKEIAEAHGGEITCRSSVGVGTEMVVRLPLPRS